MIKCVLLFIALRAVTCDDLQHHARKQRAVTFEDLFRKRDTISSDDFVSKNNHISTFLDNDNTIKQLDEHINKNSDYKKAPGFISFNVNPYLQLYRGYPSFFRQSSKRTDETLSYNSAVDETRLSKRLYEYKGAEVSAISRHYQHKFPFSNIVKLSSGCTGTLLTPYHVITAAHCVHDGAEFKDNIEMLKIEVADRIGYRMHYVVKINVPVMWLKTQGLPEVGRGAFDYAVIQLNLPVSGREQFMQLALPTVKTINTDLNFLSFFPEKSNGLWLSSCSASENLVIMGGNVVLSECETALGNSGSAVFTEDSVDGEKIIGILSNSITTPPGPYAKHGAKFESIMLLTMPKCLDICAMIYPEGEKYDVCETVKRANIEYLKVGANRIKPFFG